MQRSAGDAVSDLARPAENLRDEVRRLVDLALPIAAAQIGLMLHYTADTIMVGRFDANALAAVALGSSWSSAFTLFGFGAALGMDPAFAQAHGAGDARTGERAFVRGFALITLLAVPIVGIHMVAEPGLTWLGQPTESIPLGAEYAAVLGLSVWPMLLFNVVQRALQARGVTRPPMVAALVGAVVNVGINSVMLYGIGDWPGLGAIGVGWSTVVVRWAMLLLVVALSWSHLRPLARHLDALRETGRMLALASVAMPVAVQTALEVWAFSGSVVMVGWFGPEAIAGHIVALNMTSMAFMVPLSIGGAAAARVGNLLGAGERWQQAAWTAVTTGTSAMVFTAALFIGVPALLASIYLGPHEPAFAVAVALLPIAGAFQLFDGAQAVLFGVLRGAGDTRVPSLLAIVAFWMIGLPCSAFLAVNAGMGPQGVWWGLVVGLVTVSLLLVLRVRQVARTGGVRVTG